VVIEKTNLVIFCMVHWSWVWDLVADIEGGAEAEGVWE
jgi:hypothetical protein